MNSAHNGVPQSYFQEDRDWLQKHPPFADNWPEKCDWLDALLEKWTLKFSKEFCDSKLKPQDEIYAGYYAAMWRFLKANWKQAIAKLPAEECDNLTIDGENLINQMEGKSGRYPNNLARDFFLAQAALQGEQKAYQYILIRLAPAPNPLDNSSGDDSDTWKEAVDAQFLPREGKPRLLEEYEGRRPLKNWILYRKQKRDLTAARQRQRRNEADVKDKVAESQQKKHPLSLDCTEILSEILRTVLESLSAEDRVLLQLLILDQVNFEVAATILGVTPPTVRRRFQRIIETLQTQIQREHFSDPDELDCLEELDAETKDLSPLIQLLRDLL